MNCLNGFTLGMMPHFFLSDSDRDGRLMSKIQNDRLFKPYPHDQSSTCQNIGKVIVMYYM